MLEICIIQVRNRPGCALAQLSVNTKFEAASQPHCRLMHKMVEERVRERVNQMQDFWLRGTGG